MKNHYFSKKILNFLVKLIRLKILKQHGKKEKSLLWVKIFNFKKIYFSLINIILTRLSLYSRIIKYSIIRFFFIACFKRNILEIYFRKHNIFILNHYLSQHYYFKPNIKNTIRNKVNFILLYLQKLCIFKVLLEKPQW